MPSGLAVSPSPNFTGSVARATDTSGAGALRDAEVRNPLVQQHIRVRMYPDRTCMYLVVSPVVIEKSYFHSLRAGTETLPRYRNQGRGVAPNHMVPGDNGLELFTRAPRRIESKESNFGDSYDCGFYRTLLREDGSPSEVW